MPVTHKAEMLVLLNRCRAVVNNEMALLTRWATDTKSIARAVACEERIEIIFKRPHVRLETIVQAAAGLLPERILHAPTQGHELLVRPSEGSLGYRGSLRVDDLTDKLFFDALDRAEANCDNAMDDAGTVVEDCTSDDPHALMTFEAVAMAPRAARRAGAGDSGVKTAKRTAKKPAKKSPRRAAAGRTPASKPVSKPVASTGTKNGTLNGHLAHAG